MTTLPQFLKACVWMACLLFQAPLWGQETESLAFTGYRGLRWGTSLDEVKRLAAGDLDKVEALDPESWNAGDVAAYTGFTMGPEAYRLRYNGANGETTDYVVVQDRLCMVIQTPNFQDMFRPQRVIRQVERIYDAPIWKSERTDLSLPLTWGRLSEPYDFLLTLQWENADGRVRMAIKTWEPEDMRQVYRVVYLSRTLSDENAARLVEYRRAQAEEAERRRREAAAARAEADARAAAGQATP